MFVAIGSGMAEEVLLMRAQNSTGGLTVSSDTWRDGSPSVCMLAPKVYATPQGAI